MQDDPDLPVLSAAALRVLREDQPNRAELVSAFRRFKAQRAPRRARHLLVGRWAIAGLCLGLSVAFAAEAVVEKIQNLPGDSPGSRAAPAPSHAAPQKAVAVARLVPSSTPPEAVFPLETPPAKAPSVASPSAAPSRALPESAHGEAAPANSAAWSSAAHGLRNNDVAETQAALAELEASTNAADREAARLVRAQLLLHQGDTVAARALLTELTNQAQSASVRRKARRLLDAK